MTRPDQERMERFRQGVLEAVKKGCGDPEGGLLQIAGGPWVPCPGCMDCTEPAPNTQPDAEHS